MPGGMETWGGRRSAAYASMCGPLLPFLREGGPGAGFAEFCKGRGTPHPHARGGDDKILYGFGQVSETDKDRRTRTREEHPRFVRILTKRFNSLNKVVRILTTFYTPPLR